MLSFVAALALLTADPAAEKAFLDAKAKEPGVQSFATLRYKVLKSGPADGKRPTRTSAVRVKYEGRDITGKVFDSSPADGINFVLKMMVPGFQAPILYMRPGDEWEVYVPAELGYAHGGSARSNTTMIFKIILLDWAEIPAAEQASPILKALPGK